MNCTGCGHPRVDHMAGEKPPLGPCWHPIGPWVSDAAGGRHREVCDCGTYGNPLEAVKYAGTETQTDEEWARRQQTADAWAPHLERARLNTITALDALIQGDHP